MTERPGEEPAKDSHDFDEARWREIVANFGDRATLDEEPAAPTPAQEYVEVYAESSLDDSEPEPDFVPPPPPPLPRPEPKRALAWGGVFVAPALLLLVTLTDVYLPAVIGYVLLAWFVGGFGYLVFTMSGEPRDPWDDGSRV